MTQEDYDVLNEKINKYDEEMQRRFLLDPMSIKLDTIEIPKCWRSPDADSLRGLPPKPTDAERSSCEVFQFNRDKPKQYAVHLSHDMKLVTTRTRQQLGRVISTGSKYGDGFGSICVNTTVMGVNGVRYYGTHYSAGNYAHLTACKDQS